ncbi:MAG: hypothetical protein AAF555_01695 [Verrucomicrobiota bacterium]
MFSLLRSALALGMALLLGAVAARPLLLCVSSEGIHLAHEHHHEPSACCEGEASRGEIAPDPCSEFFLDLGDLPQVGSQGPLLPSLLEAERPVWGVKEGWPMGEAIPAARPGGGLGPPGRLPGMGSVVRRC